jgi:hypothetical protein
MANGIQAVSDAVLDDLRTRLERTRWPGVVEGQGWARGTDLDYLGELVDYWRTGFDWRAQESALSRLTTNACRYRIYHFTKFMSALQTAMRLP